MSGDDAPKKKISKQLKHNTLNQTPREKKDEIKKSPDNTTYEDNATYENNATYEDNATYEENDCKPSTSGIKEKKKEQKTQIDTVSSSLETIKEKGEKKNKRETSSL